MTTTEINSSFSKIILMKQIFPNQIFSLVSSVIFRPLTCVICFIHSHLAQGFFLYSTKRTVHQKNKHNQEFGINIYTVHVRARLLQSCPTIAHEAPVSMGFSRQEYWSGLPYPPPGDLPNPGIEPASLMSTCTGRYVLYCQCRLGSPYILQYI